MDINPNYRGRTKRVAKYLEKIEFDLSLSLKEPSRAAKPNFFSTAGCQPKAGSVYNRKWNVDMKQNYEKLKSTLKEFYQFFCIN
jgi:hypothetical protein